MAGAPLGPPDEAGSPYAASSAFAAWDGFLGHPGRGRLGRERAAFRRANGFWIDDWTDAGGASTISSLRREWSALRAYAAERGSG